MYCELNIRYHLSSDCSLVSYNEVKWFNMLDDMST